MALLVFPFLLLTTIQTNFVKSSFSRNGYHQVSSCPTTKSEWEARSLMLNCNSTNQYHCSPFNTSQLYEFCYQRKVFKVYKEHCLGIAENGNLNLDTCKFFVRGCPTEDYYSNESFKYPSCLSIHDNCYTEDCVCNCLTAKKLNLTATCTCRSNIISGSCEKHYQYLPGFVVFVLLFVISIGSNIVFAYKWCTLRQGKRRSEINKTAAERKPLVSNAKERDRYQTSDKQQSSKSEPDDIYRMTLVDFTIEDEQLFNLLKRQCLHGFHSEFEYLMRTRVKDNKKEYIFEQRDKNGCLLLHYAAQGGNTIILDDILDILKQKCPNILEEKCIRGQCALHFAIKHQQKDMIDHLIKLHSERKNQNAESTATQQESEFDTVTCRGEFSPVHLAAWFGDTRLLTTLMKNGFKINRQTRNGLNILDIACMKQLCGESETEFQFCEHLIINNLLKPNDLSKTDMSGWNIAHYASLSNFKLFEYITYHDEIHELVMVKTKALKTCLHIACEFGKTEIVRFIAGHFTLKALIPEIDNLGWNALHFAAKGGELEILECLLKIDGMEIDSKTDDGKTLLHIACIYKKTEICEFLIKQFRKNKNKYKELLNTKTTTNKLTAAHYLAVEKKEDGSEREILKMLINTKQVDLSAIDGSGLTVLEFAVDHVNKDLIECILSAEYREEFKINAAILENCKNHARDDRIKQILERTLSEINT